MGFPGRLHRFRRAFPGSRGPGIHPSAAPARGVRDRGAGCRGHLASLAPEPGIAGYTYRMISSTRQAARAIPGLVLLVSHQEIDTNESCQFSAHHPQYPDVPADRAGALFLVRSGADLNDWQVPAGCDRADRRPGAASDPTDGPVSYTHLRAHETDSYLV